MSFQAALRSALRDTRVQRGMISLVALVLGAWLQWHGGFFLSTAANEWLRDKFIQLHAQSTAEQRVLVIDIDESSVAHQAWPWPRARIADLIELALADGARGVGLDILFEKPADAPGDTRLSMLAANGPVVLAQLFDYTRNDAPLASGRLVAGQPARGSAGPVPAQGYLANHAGFAQAHFAGNIGVLPDADGSLRRLPMFTIFQGRVYPTLSLALLQCCSGTTAPPATPAGRAHSLCARLVGL